MGLIVITGANRGIGLALTRVYRARNMEVLGACRRGSEELAATGAEVQEGVDICTGEGRARLRAGVGDRTVDLLINNAGVWCDDALGDLDGDQLCDTFMVNAAAPLLLTDALLDAMAPGSKIGLITSRMGSIADNTSGGRYGYRMSKAALNAAGKSLALDLMPRGIPVAILHPGFVQTRMVGFAGEVTPGDSAAGLVQCLDSLTLENSGTFLHARGTELPW